MPRARSWDPSSLGCHRAGERALAVMFRSAEAYLRMGQRAFEKD